MRAVLVKIRFAENGIALLFIKWLCLLLGVQTDFTSADVSDLGFSSGKDPGTEMISTKFFFNGGYNNQSGESIASASVKEKIRDIVSSEPPQKPFSDAKIADILSGDGITIARRTVAKYREEIGIPAKSLRKRF